MQLKPTDLMDSNAPDEDVRHFLATMILFVFGVSAVGLALFLAIAGLVWLGEQSPVAVVVLLGVVAVATIGWALRVVSGG